MTRESGIPQTMSGVVLTGHGGPERLVWRDDLPVPRPGPHDVLIRVGASAVNNTDINTRTGWYSKAVSASTEASDRLRSEGDVDRDGSWSGIPLEFPRIQGADCCGEIVAVGRDVARSRIGQRVLVRVLQNLPDPDRPLITFGSERDGAFAEFTTARSIDALAVDSTLSDLELASFPCAFSTAECMLQRAGVVDAERVLITGASGGVGSAAVQLASKRGAEVTAMTSSAKAEAVRALGAAETVDRGASFARNAFDVVVDLVGGDRWPLWIDALRPGGRYVTAGAIAGPLVELDLRTLYLRDLTFHGCTQQPDSVFEDLVGRIERRELRPRIAASYPLHELAAAQEAFLEKDFVGKIGIEVRPC